MTGRGFDRRKLYTDKESIILSVKRPIVFTCLHLPTTRADFLDRSMILDLERVLPETRRDLRTLEAEFEAARPRLFGALLGLWEWTVAAKLEYDSVVTRLAHCRTPNSWKNG